MRLALIILAFALMFPIASKAMEQTAEKPSLVMFYANSCGACKILDPKIKQVLDEATEDKINIVIFDFSDRDAINKTRELAAEKSLTPVLNHYGAKTGFAVLVNPQGDILDVIKYNDDVTEISAKIAKALS